MIRIVSLNLSTTQLNISDNLMLETINNIKIKLYTIMDKDRIEKMETIGAMQSLGLKKTTCYKLLKEYKNSL